MTNVLVKKTLLLAFMLAMMGMASAQSINYGFSYSLSQGTLNPNSLNIFPQETLVSDMAFNSDGSKLFIIGYGGDEVNQYSLGTPYDINGSVTHEGLYSVATQETSPHAMFFSTDGTKLFITGSGDAVHQYTLNTAFDITGTVTHNGSYPISGQDGNARGLAFSTDGTKMFVLGDDGNDVNQYGLSSAFNITTGVTVTGTFSVASQETSPTGIAFNDDGTKMFVCGLATDQAYEYTLTTPFSILTGVSYSGTSLTLDDSFPMDIEFGNDGGSLFLVGTGDDAVQEYDLQAGGFEEVALNDGSVEGSLLIGITGETFTNQGGTLAHGSNYTILNLPSGLTPNLSVASGGALATLTFTGNAVNNQNANSLTSLQFTFQNSAFTGGNAGAVANATNAQSGTGIIFDDNIPIINYGYSYDLTNTSSDGVSYNVTSQESNPHGVAFNDDGTKLFITGSGSDAIHQYSLTNPFDLSTGVSYDGSPFSVSSQTNFPTDLNFSADGMSMYVSADAGTATIYQYTLSNAFDITSGVSFNTSISVEAQESTMQGMTLSTDGTKMYVVGLAGDAVNQYTLSTPFNVSTATFDGGAFDISTEELDPIDISFSPDGRTMLILGSQFPDNVHQYQLSTPFDITAGKIGYKGAYEIGSGTGPSAFTLGKSGNKIFLLDFTADNVNQFTLEPGFTESAANTGSIDGSADIRISGETFSNSGGTLTHGADYTINNLPSGLAPNLAVSGDGTNAILTFSGSASSNQNTHDVASLEFTFSNSAFAGEDASGVTNSTNAESHLGIDFSDNPVLTYNSGSFTESPENNGVLDGSTTITISGDTFTNANSNLTFKTDYTISNLPAGLTPNLAISADGLTATMTLSGNATNHQDIHDVSGLIFTFVNSAFTGNNVAAVLNATSHNSGFDLDFNDNNPILTYGFPYEVDNLTNNGSFAFTNEDNLPQGVAFNEDGTKLYMVGAQSLEIHQYSISKPFTVTSGVTYDNVSYDISGQTSDPRDLVFNDTGTKLFLIGQDNDEVYQYNLSSPYDLSSTVTYQAAHSVGSGFPFGLAFGDSGNTMVVAKAGVLLQFGLSTPYDITTGVISDGSVSILATTDRIHGIHFNEDGSSLLLIENVSRSVREYSLDIPYNVYSGHSLIQTTFISSYDSEPMDIAFNVFGTEMFIIGGASDSVFEFDLDAGGFYEATANDGSVTGSLTFSLFEDQFENASGTLTSPTHYTIFNAPSGLSHSMTVAADGLSAVLSFTETATANDESNSIESLNISFNDAAFVIGDASIVANSSSSDNGYGIDFIEAPSITNQSFSIAENSANASVVGGVLATDPDEDALDFSITAGNNLGAFALDAISGELTVADENELDFETNPSFSLTVEVSDGALSSSATVTIDLTNVAEAPTDLNLDVSSIAENNVVGDIIGQLTTTDVDAGETYTYTLEAGTGDDDNTSFTLDGDQLKAAEVFDFETKNTYSIRIQTDDGNGGILAKTLSISITNQFEAPTDISLSNSSIAENNAINDAVGNFSTVDEDSGESYVYALVAGVGDDDNASFSIVGNELQAKEVFDFETKNTYSIRVQTDDQNGNTFEKDFSIIISDQSEAPTNIILTGTAVDENNAVSYLVSSLSTEDEDSGETHIYSLVSGSGDDDNGSFTLFGNQLRAAEVFNFETQSSYSVRLQTDDQNGGVFADSYTISINDINDDPTDVLITSDNVDENLSIGSLVGTLSSEDEDTGDSHTYSLKAGNTDNNSFAISGNQLLTDEMFDFENKVTYNLEIITDDGNGGTFEQEIAITINDANDDPSDVALSANTVVENAAVNTVVGTFSTTDQDSGDSFTYSLVAGSGDSDNASFNINGNELRTSSAFNFEVQNSYSIRLETNDGNGGTREEAFTISVTDATDDPTDILLSVSSIQENNAINEVIGTLSSVDEDASESHTYSLVSGAGDADNASFNIVGDQLRASEAFDFETQDSYSVRVETNDGNSGLFEKVFTITINDESETPSDILLSSSDIDESSPVGTTVGNLSTEDEDNGESYTYTLVSGSGDTDNASFTIDGNQLKSSEVFDFETKTSYSIRVQTNDGNGGLFEKAFTISINDQPPGLTGVGITSTSIDEEGAIGAPVGNLFALGDEIAGVSFTFTLVSGTGDTGNGSFSIVGEQLRSAVSFDHESQDLYSIRVMADDGAGSTIEQVLLIDINDVNEAPTDIQLTASAIDENNSINAIIGELSTSDVDAADTHSYLLVSGSGDTDNALFNISGSDLRASTVFNFEAKSSYSIRVQTNDGNGGNFEEVFAISINDAAEAPTALAITGASIDENNSINDVIGSFITSDEDAGETYAYSLVSGTFDDDNSLFNILGDQLRASEVFDFETKSSMLIRVQTDDGNGGIFERGFSISVNDVNEAPTDIQLSNLSIEESNPVNSSVGLLSSTDEDAGQTHSYSLVAGTGDTDNASFSIVGNEVVSAEIFDFESKSSYSIRVQSVDGNGGSFEKSFTISIEDLPAQITSFELGNASINENEAVGSVIGSFSTSGEDLSGSFTYSLVSGVGSENNSDFTISGNQLLAAFSFDFESQNTYSVRVMVDDGTGNTDEKSFTISVNDVSESPTDLSLSANSISENNSVGDAIGSFTTTDEDTGESFTYSLVSGTGDTDNASFSIAGNELHAAEVFDFETKSSYSLRIETNDGNGGTFQKSFTVTITNENESILVSNPIADQQLDEGFTSVEINLAGVFTDQDGDALTYNVSSSSTGIVTVSELNGTLTITEAGNLGTSTITVTANDGSGVTTSDEFEVAVSNVNDSPVVANAIADQNEDEGFGSLELDLFSTFTDEDEDNLSLSASSSDESVATVSISATTLTISEIGNGTTTITVTADDGNGGTGSDEFILTVNNVNDAPIVANAIADQVLDEGFGTLDLDLSATFSDEDGDDLTFSVSSNDETVAAASISGTILTIAEAGIGSSTVAVTANDGNGGSVSDQFTVTVNNVNDAPVVANAIADQTQEEGFGSIDIELANTFSDADGDALTLSVVSSDETVATASISGTVLSLTEAGIGATTITVTANDGNGESVTDAFIVTITEAPNNAPVVANAIADQNEEEGFGSIDIDLANTFSDADGDALTLSVVSGDETVVTAAISGTTLTLTEAGIGSSTITVTANDGNGGSVSDEFSIEVIEALNNAPVVANAIADQSEEEGFGSIDIDLSDTFSDPDGDALTLSVVSSDETVVTASIVGTTLTLTEAGIGSSTITVTANDGNGGSVSDEFSIEVIEAPNNAPTVANPIADQSFEEGFGSTQISLANVFSDADGDNLIFNVSSSDETVATATIANDQIEITERGIGVSTLTITADDGNGGTVSTEFTFTVEDVLGLGENIEVKVYPNPVVDFLKVEGLTEMEVKVFDLNGREITSGRGQSIQLDMRPTRSGSYIIKINSDRGSKTQRIVKAN